VPRASAGLSFRVAMRSSGARAADVCFRDRDSTTRLASLPPILRRQCLGAVACSQPRATDLSKHTVARGLLALRLAKRHCLCLNPNSELRRLPHPRGDAAVSRARGDDWSSSEAPVGVSWNRASRPPPRLPLRRGRGPSGRSRPSSDARPRGGSRDWRFAGRAGPCSGDPLCRYRRPQLGQRRRFPDRSAAVSRGVR